MKNLLFKLIIVTVYSVDYYCKECCHKIITKSYGFHSSQSIGIILTYDNVSYRIYTFDLGSLVTIEYKKACKKI